MTTLKWSSLQDEQLNSLLKKYQKISSEEIIRETGTKKN
jgi:hypothetical protein